MSLPSLPNFYDMQWVDKSGNLSTDAHMFCDEAFQTLNTVILLLNLIADARVINDGSVNRGTVVNDGLVAPSKTTAEITAFGSDTSIANGTMWFDTDISKLKVKTAAGTIETITSS